MDLSVLNKTLEDAVIEDLHNKEQMSSNGKHLKETDHKEFNNFLNNTKTVSNNEIDCNHSSNFQGVTTNNNETSLKVENSIFNYASFKKAMDLRTDCRRTQDKPTIFDDADYFAKNHLYKLVPITFEAVDETIIHIEHNYCHSYVSSESEAEELCSRTLDLSQVREKNYKKRRTKTQESPDDEEKDENDQNDQNIAFFSSTLNANCGSDLVKEKSIEVISLPQPLDLSARIVQDKKTDLSAKEHQHGILNCNNNNNTVEEKKVDLEFDSDKENLKSKLKCIEVTITGSAGKKNYQPCDLFLNDIARLVPKLIGKDCSEVDIFDRTSDRYVDVKKHRLYYIISESTWRRFQSTNERIILTNDQSLGQLFEKKDSREKPSFLIFDQNSLARCLADHCKEIGGRFEYTYLEENKEELTDPIEVVGGKQNSSKKVGNHCNDFEKGADMEIKMENKPEKRTETYRKDEMKYSEKSDIRQGPSLLTAIARSEDKVKSCGSKSKINSDECGARSSYSSETLKRDGTRESRDIESPKCGRKKCASSKYDCPPAFSERRVSWKKNSLKSCKRASRNRCMAKKRKSCVARKKRMSKMKKRKCGLPRKKSCPPKKKKVCSTKKKKSCSLKKKKPSCSLRKMSCTSRSRQASRSQIRSYGTKARVSRSQRSCRPKSRMSCSQRSYRPKSRVSCSQRRSCGPKRARSCGPKRTRSCAPKRKSSCPPKRKSSCAPKRKSSCAPKRKSSCAPKRKSSCPPRKKSSCAPKRKSSCAPKRKTSCAPKRKNSCVPKRKTQSYIKRKKSCGPQRKKSSGLQRKKTYVVPRKKSCVPQRKKSCAPQRKKSSARQGKKSCAPQRKKSYAPQRKRSCGPPRKKSYGNQRKKSYVTQSKKSCAPQKKRSMAETRKKNTPDKQGKKTPKQVFDENCKKVCDDLSKQICAKKKPKNRKTCDQQKQKPNSRKRCASANTTSTAKKQCRRTNTNENKKYQNERPRRSERIQSKISCKRLQTNGNMDKNSRSNSGRKNSSTGGDNGKNPDGNDSSKCTKRKMPIKCSEVVRKRTRLEPMKGCKKKEDKCKKKKALKNKCAKKKATVKKRCGTAKGNARPPSRKSRGCVPRRPNTRTGNCKNKSKQNVRSC